MPGRPKSPKEQLPRPTPMLVWHRDTMPPVTR